MINVNLDKNIKGTILDIGGGGEGIIGRIYQCQVTAIDITFILVKTFKL